MMINDVALCPIYIVVVGNTGKTKAMTFYIFNTALHARISACVDSEFSNTDGGTS